MFGLYIWGKTIEVFGRLPEIVRSIVLISQSNYFKHWEFGIIDIPLPVTASVDLHVNFNRLPF